MMLVVREDVFAEAPACPEVPEMLSGGSLVRGTCALRGLASDLDNDIVARDCGVRRDSVQMLGR